MGCGVRNFPYFGLSARGPRGKAEAKNPPVQVGPVADRLHFSRLPTSLAAAGSPGITSAKANKAKAIREVHLSLGEETHQTLCRETRSICTPDGFFSWNFRVAGSCRRKARALPLRSASSRNLSFGQYGSLPYAFPTAHPVPPPLNPAHPQTDRRRRPAGGRTLDPERTIGPVCRPPTSSPRRKCPISIGPLGLALVYERRSATSSSVRRDQSRAPQRIP